MFFFHIRDASSLVEDLEGSELPDLAAAHAEACGAARNLLAELIRAERLRDGMSIEIADEMGRIVGSVLLMPLATTGNSEQRPALT